MKAVILGATRGMGRSLSRLLAEQGHDVFLLGIGDEDLRDSAADVAERAGGIQSKVKVGFAVCDLEQPDTFAPALDAASATLGGFDTVIVTAGLFATQDRLENDIEFTRRLLVVNYAHTVVFCEHARKRLLASGGGTICAFSSVAGDRGRKPVVLYGSSKAGLSAYLEGLDHKYRSAGLKAITIKPGFVKTGMTEGLPVPPFAGTPEQVAGDVLRAIQKGSPVVYTPFMWRWVMLVIRHLPRFVMRKIGF
jgi:decaprenylphospho-beta-D-erythro-pentofuranosid-2-ulose 2-reductase